MSGAKETFEFGRYAVFFTPELGSELARLGAAWLGWDIARGMAVTQPFPALDSATQTPRRYGFHATLKPPMRLDDGRTAAELVACLDDFCAARAPVVVAELALTAMGGWLALIPSARTEALQHLAAEIVRAFDDFRAPAPPEEIARRTAAGLTQRQTEHLKTWGYPYVMEDFRPHLTLTGRLDDAARARLEPVARGHFAAHLGAPLVIDALTLCGERPDKRFEAIKRVPLRGA